MGYENAYIDAWTKYFEDQINGLEPRFSWKRRKQDTKEILQTAVKKLAKSAMKR